MPLLTPCTHIVGSYNVGKLRAEGGMMPSPAVRFPMARRTLPSDEVCAQSEVGKIMCVHLCTTHTCKSMYVCMYVLIHARLCMHAQSQFPKTPGPGAYTPALHPRDEGPPPGHVFGYERRVEPFFVSTLAHLEAANVPGPGSYRYVSNQTLNPRPSR